MNSLVSEAMRATSLRFSFIFLLSGLSGSIIAGEKEVLYEAMDKSRAKLAASDASELIKFIGKDGLRVRSNSQPPYGRFVIVDNGKESFVDFHGTYIVVLGADGTSKMLVDKKRFQHLDEILRAHDYKAVQSIQPAFDLGVFKKDGN